MMMWRVLWIGLFLASMILSTDTADSSELTDELGELRKLVLTRIKEEQQAPKGNTREEKSESNINNEDLKKLILALQQRELINNAAKGNYIEEGSSREEKTLAPDGEDFEARSGARSPSVTNRLDAESLRRTFDVLSKRAKCAAGKVKCPSNGKCMALGWLCDGHDDCKGWDEDPSVCIKYPCQSGHEHCPGGYKCISKEWLCDGENDCPDGGDESTSICESHTCPERKYKCRTGTTCLGRKRFCNGKVDCDDGSDEDVDVCKRVPCSSGRVRCPGGAKCIHPTWECDGEEDCEDGFDEARELCESKLCSDDRVKCQSRKGSFICLYKDYMCDGIGHCLHDWDEKESNCAVVECGEGHVRCSDDSCVSLYAYCGGWAKCKGKPVTEVSCEDFFLHDTYKRLSKKVLSISDEAERERLLNQLVDGL